MADLAASAVSRQRVWVEGDRSGKLVQKCVDAILTLTAQGTTTNKITAAVLGLSKIYEAQAITDGNTLLIARPSYDGTNLLLFDVSGATDATRDDPVDITDTIRVIVRGKE